MKKLGKRVIISTLLAIVLTIGIVGVAFAQDNGNGASYGESSDGSGPCLQNRWGNNAGAGYGVCRRAGTDEANEGTEICLQKRWGRTAGAGLGVCERASYGESSDGAGPGLQNY